MILHDGRHPSNRNCHPLSLYFFCSCYVFGQEFGHFFFAKRAQWNFSDSFSRSTKKLAGYEELAGAFEPIRKRRYKILEVKKTYCREEAMDQFGKLQAPPSSRTLIRNEPFSTGHDKWPTNACRDGHALQLPENTVYCYLEFTGLITYWFKSRFYSWLKPYSFVLTITNECNFTFPFFFTGTAKLS